MVEMEKGDILGHEFCGVVDDVGPAVHNVKKGDRVVASFQIACGECLYCKQKLSSQCSRTNASSLEYGMYGGNTAGYVSFFFYITDVKKYSTNSSCAASSDIPTSP